MNEMDAGLSREETELLAVAAQKTIDLTPVGMRTPEGCKRVTEAVEEWNASAHAVANAVKQLLDEYDDIDATYPGFREDLYNLKALIGARDRHQEKFLRAVAGAPPAA